MATYQPPARQVATTFAQKLIEVNKLDSAGFRRWIFFPGMLFLSENSWWGDGRPRPYSHEGIDLCLFANADGRRLRLDSSVWVPAADNCRIVSVIDDFIGKTIVCFPDGALNPVVLYAHVLPADGIAPGDAVRKGELIARIAPAGPERTPLPPHLHVTLIRAGFLSDPERLSWHSLNRLDRSAFIDPLHVLGFSENGIQMVDFDPAITLYDEYESFGSRLSG